MWQVGLELNLILNVFLTYDDNEMKRYNANGKT